MLSSFSKHVMDNLLMHVPLDSIPGKKIVAILFYSDSRDNYAIDHDRSLTTVGFF